MKEKVEINIQGQVIQLEKNDGENGRATDTANEKICVWEREKIADDIGKSIKSLTDWPRPQPTFTFPALKPVEISRPDMSYVQKIHEENVAHRKLQDAGAQASIESRNQLIEQNELLKKQLFEQTEINQRLAHEFEMGAREAVITRQKANWSLGIGIVGLFVAIIAAVVGVMK